MRARACSNNWVEVGSTLGGVWYRGSRQTFVAVRPDGSVLGADYRSRVSAILGLVWDARERERFPFRPLLALFGGTPATRGAASPLVVRLEN